jgi:hypothetical protein
VYTPVLNYFLFLLDKTSRTFLLPWYNILTCDNFYVMYHTVREACFCAAVAFDPIFWQFLSEFTLSHLFFICHTCHHPTTTHSPTPTNHTMVPIFTPLHWRFSNQPQKGGGQAAATRVKKRVIGGSGGDNDNRGR